MKILLIIILFPPVVIFSQPDYLRKDLSFKDSNPNVNPALYKKAGVKKQISWYQKDDNAANNLMNTAISYSKDGKVTEYLVYSENQNKVRDLFYTFNAAGLMVEVREEFYSHDTVSSVDITTYVYDSQNRITLIATERKSTRLSTIIAYNKPLNMVTQFDFSKDSILMTTQNYYYNDKGFLVKLEYHSVYNGEVTDKHYDYIYSSGSFEELSYTEDSLENNETYNFNDKGKITKIMITKPGKSPYKEYEADYNSFGLVLTEKSFGSRGKEEWRYERKYDENGNKTVEDYYNYLDNSKYRSISKYDKNGLLTEFATGGMDVDFKKGKTVYTYEYY